MLVLFATLTIQICAALPPPGPLEQCSPFQVRSQQPYASYELCEKARQAGVDENVWLRAAQLLNVRPGHDLVLDCYPATRIPIPAVSPPPFLGG